MAEAQRFLTPELVADRRTGRLQRRTYYSEVTHFWTNEINVCKFAQLDWYLGLVLLRTQAAALLSKGQV